VNCEALSLSFSLCSAKRQRRMSEESQDSGHEPFTEPEDEGEGPLQQDALDELYGLPVRGRPVAGSGPAMTNRGAKLKVGPGRPPGRPPGSKNKTKRAETERFGPPAAAPIGRKTPTGSKKKVHIHTHDVLLVAGGFASQIHSRIESLIPQRGVSRHVDQRCKLHSLIVTSRVLWGGRRRLRRSQTTTLAAPLATREGRYQPPIGPL